MPVRPTHLVLNINSDGVTNNDFSVADLHKAMKQIDQNKSSALDNIRSNGQSSSKIFSGFVKGVRN